MEKKIHCLTSTIEASHWAKCVHLWYLWKRWYKFTVGAFSE